MDNTTNQIERREICPRISEHQRNRKGRSTTQMAKERRGRWAWVVINNRKVEDNDQNTNNQIDTR
jgi:hypothetical protein